MSDAPTPKEVDPVPTAEELRDTAVPAAIRRAPRVGRMVGTGVLFGILLGVVLGLALPNSTGVGRGVVVVLLSIGFAMCGGLIAGVIGTRMDRPLANASDGPLFPQDAIVTEQVATRDIVAEGSQAADATAGSSDDGTTAIAPTDRPNGDTT